MPTKAKNLSIRSRFNIFANSPKVVKIFGPLLILMLLAAAVYGGYILYNQRYGDAATSDRNTWYYNSGQTGHWAGYKGTIFSKGVWVADEKTRGQLVWWGPYKDLATEHQYIGCFFYAFDLNNTNGGSAVIDITNNAGQQILRQYTINSSQPRKEGTFRRTCLAFYVPKSMGKNGIELRVKNLSGILYIRKTKISMVTPQNNELLNQWIFKSGPDNQTITHSYGFKN